MLGNLKNILRLSHIRFLSLIERYCKDINISGVSLIIAPHPDDEALGCGGLIARLCAANNPPHVAILTGGGGSLRGWAEIAEVDVIKARRRLTLDSARQLGLPKENIHFLDFEDGSIEARLKTEIDRLGELIDIIKPDNIFVPHSGEGWPDHLAAREIGIELAPPSTVVWEYCVWMWYYNVWNLDWKNAYVLRMSSKELNSKLQAVDAYVKPLSSCGKPWSGILPKLFIKANTSKSELYFIHRAPINFPVGGNTSVIYHG
ncbi:MAG: PIG-L family deacetylase [Muribaculaceae bacterium]|nr:PIG-L family deacetylase [Muribaculaceae bacterium]